MDLEEKINQHILDEERRLAGIEHDIANLATQVKALEASVHDLVAAWQTASGVVGFVKWLAGITTAVLTIAAAIKLGIWKV